MKKIKLFSVSKKEIPAQKYLMNIFDASEIEIVYILNIDEIFKATSVKNSRENCQEIAQKVVKMAIDNNCNVFYCDTNNKLFDFWANIYASGIFFKKTENGFYDIQEDVGIYSELSCVYFDYVIWKKIF